MKRLANVLLVLMLSLLVACSSNDGEKESKKTGEQTQEEEGVNVDKGLLNVEITLPASMFEGQDLETIIAEAEKQGISDVTKNEDGSVTYKMSKSEHKELMSELSETIKESVEEMKNDEEFVSIKDITYNKSFTEFTLIVDKEAYENSFDAFASMGLGMSGAMYQLYSGANPDDYQVTINVQDEATQEVFDTTVYPDDLEEATEEVEE